MGYAYTIAETKLLLYFLVFTRIDSFILTIKLINKIPNDLIITGMI